MSRGGRIIGWGTALPVGRLAEGRRPAEGGRGRVGAVDGEGTAALRVADAAGAAVQLGVLRA